MNHKTDMQADLKRIASELRAYNPAADEYKGEHIHKVWAREIEAALSGQSAGVPTGYALVPIEPTVEMIAALGFAGDADIAIGHARAFKETVDAYASMLAAAPAPVGQSVGVAAEPKRGTDAQILFERRLTCEAINGAIAFGYQNTNRPPSDDHWLAPFWKIGRKQAELEAVLTGPSSSETIHQVWVEKTSSWADVTPAYYSERLPSNRRKVYYKPTFAGQSAGVADDIAEGLEILDNFIASVRENGNYSTEATLTFIGQARQCFAAAPAPVSAPVPDREQATLCEDGGKCGIGGYCGQCEKLRAASDPEQPKQSVPAPLSEYHEDTGPVVWWTWQDGLWLGEPAWIGAPTDSDWPGYHTHWTYHPEFPLPPLAVAAKLNEAPRRVTCSLTHEQISALYLHLLRRPRPEFGWMEAPLVAIESALMPVHGAIHDRGFNAMNRQFFGDDRFKFEERNIPPNIEPAEQPSAPDYTDCCDTPSLCSSVRRCTAQDAPRARGAACPHGVDDGACKQCYGEAMSGEQGAANDQNSAKHRYFVYDPEGNGFDLYDTDAQREAAHLAAIAEARQAAMDDGEWALDVERIVSGFVTHTTVAAEMDGGGCDYAPLSAFNASAPTLGEAIYQHDQGDGFWKDVPYAEWQLLGAKWRRIVYTTPASAPALGEQHTDERAAFEAWWNANETWPVAAKNLALLAWTTRANRPQPQAAEPKQPPFGNCQFRICDLPGQCRAEGKCHHPAAQAAEPKGMTATLRSYFETIVKYLEADLPGLALNTAEKARALLAKGE